MKIYRLTYLEGGPKGGSWRSVPKDRIRFKLVGLRNSVSQYKSMINSQIRYQKRYDESSEEERGRYYIRHRPEVKHMKWRIEYADVQWHVLEEGDTRYDCEGDI